MAHKITSQDQWFLNLRRHDPLQGSEFELGDKVVVCTKCKCVQAYDSWAFNENKCVQCGHNHSTDDFSREYIDFSYHREDTASKVIRGFKVVESDVKYQTDKIRKWFSQQRIAKTNRAFLWLSIILLMLIIGFTYYWGHDSIMYYVSASIIPMFNTVVSKLQYFAVNKISDIGISTKFVGLDKDIGLIINKFNYLQSKFILLGTSLLYIGKKFLYSLTGIKWSQKESTVATNFRALIDYITHFVKR